MHVSMGTLLLATVVYILSNLGVVYVHCDNMFSDCTDASCMSWASTAYHWLYLACLADPIAQPIIVLYRMRTMRHTHLYWIAQFRGLQWSSLLRNTIEWIYFTLCCPSETPSPSNSSPTVRPQRNDKECKQSAISGPQRKTGVRLVDNDLSGMLQYLEEERRQARDGTY
uniref:Uncharacterized protein n=1 Tax=Ditylenchus dipsaci TaxID=166011 RepID=A0A915DY98_9BILA